MKLIFYGLLLIYGFREIHISMESTESYKLWIMFSVLQCSCDLYLMKSCCYFSSRIKFLHWHKLEVSESRSLFTLLAKMVLMEAPPFRTSMHVTHSSEQHQCQNVSLEEIKLGQVDVTYLRVHRGSLSHFSECDLNLAVSVQNLKWVSLSHYLWLWRETSCSVHVPRRRETRKEGEWRTAGEVQMWRKKLSPSDFEVRIS